MAEQPYGRIPDGTVRDPRASMRGGLDVRRPLSAPYESLTFPLVTRARRELVVTLAAQPVFDLEKSRPVSRRIRRTIRHQGGEEALGFGRRTLEPADLKRIDLQSLRHGLDLLRLGAEDSGILPGFWRSVAASPGRFAAVCAELQQATTPGALLIEIMGGLEQTPVETINDAMEHFEDAGLGAILHVAPDIASARRLTPVRAQCIALDFAGVAHEFARDWQPASQLIGAARQACPQVLLLNLRPDRGMAAHMAGATHAVFAGLDPITV